MLGRLPSKLHLQLSSLELLLTKPFTTRRRLGHMSTHDINAVQRWKGRSRKVAKHLSYIMRLLRIHGSHLCVVLCRTERESAKKRSDLLLKLESMPEAELLVDLMMALMALPRHKQSWEAVNGYIETKMKVWQVKAEESILPTLMPWLNAGFEDATYLRQPSEEATMLILNLPTCGIVPSMKVRYVVQLVTGLLTQLPSNGVAILVHANRATTKAHVKDEEGLRKME